jgi:O-Antigen ligase
MIPNLPSFAMAQSAERSVSSLFYGPWIRWSELTTAERFVCAFIMFTPLWWFIGWVYVWFLITGSILSYHLWQGKGLGLRRPSWFVISGFLFQLYRSGSAILNTPGDIKPSTWIGLMVGLCLYFIIWFIENNNIKVRIEVLAWTISVLVIELLTFWIVAQLIFKAPHFTPPRTLISQFLDRSERYIKGDGASNYLLPYSPEDKLPGGLSRFGFFYPVPEDFGLISASITTFSLEIKNRYWRAALFWAGFLLLFVSGTRMAWISFSTIMLLRYIILTSKAWGISAIFALIGLSCFLMFSVPHITDTVSNTFATTTQSTSDFRRDSSEVRAKIYRRTWDEVISDPDPSKLLLGRGITGPTVVPGFKPAQIGSHSFLLGNLLYRQGLVGSSLFLIFWGSFIAKLFLERAKRPMFSLLIVVFITLTFPTMEYMLGHSLLILFALLPATRPKLDFAKTRRHQIYAPA